jgi:hypothetical protein
MLAIVSIFDLAQEQDKAGAIFFADFETSKITFSKASPHVCIMLAINSAFAIIQIQAD